MISGLNTYKKTPQLEFSKTGSISFTTSPLNKNPNRNAFYVIVDKNTDQKIPIFIIERCLID